MHYAVKFKVNVGCVLRITNPVEWRAGTLAPLSLPSFQASAWATWCNTGMILSQSRSFACNGVPKRELGNQKRTLKKIENL